jgi:hypothetical protein
MNSGHRVKNGKVYVMKNGIEHLAIVLSNSYVESWSYINGVQCATYAPLVTYILQGNDSSDLVEKIHDDDGDEYILTDKGNEILGELIIENKRKLYLDALSSLRVAYVKKGVFWQVTEYDGLENIKIFDPENPGNRWNRS